LGSNQRRLSRRFYRPLLRATLHTNLPAQTSPDRFRHGDAVRYMYVAAGCPAADSTDSHVQLATGAREHPKPAGRSTGPHCCLPARAPARPQPRLPPRTPRTSEHTTGLAAPIYLPCTPDTPSMYFSRTPYHSTTLATPGDARRGFAVRFVCPLEWAVVETVDAAEVPGEPAAFLCPLEWAVDETMDDAFVDGLS
jgi:hypothetical protein